MFTNLVFVLLAILSISSATKSEKMVGGWSSIDVNDRDIQDLSWRAMKGINEQANDIFYLMPIKILSAKSQVVAGMNYELEILVGQTNARKNQLSAEDFGPHSVKEKEGGRRQIYNINVWQKPWENFEEFTIKQVKDA